MMGFSLTGMVVYVKEDQFPPKKEGDKPKPYKRVQMLVNDGSRRAQLIEVMDFANADWVQGREITVPVSLSIYDPGKTGKAGNPTLNVAHYGTEKKPVGSQSGRI